MERKFAKGDKVDEQINRIDKTLQHFSRRLSHKIIGVLPAAPVFEFVYAPNSDGVVLRRIIPVAGTISKAAIFVQSKETKGASLFRLEIRRGEKYWAEAFEVGKKPIVEAPGIKVEAGDLVTLMVEEPEAIKGIWAAFLFNIAAAGLEKTEFVFDQIEHMMKEDLEDAGES